MNKFITDGLSVERKTVPTVGRLLSSPHLRLAPGEFYPPSDFQIVNFVDNDGNVVTRYLNYCNSINKFMSRIFLF